MEKLEAGKLEKPLLIETFMSRKSRLIKSLNTSKTTAIAFGSPHTMGIFERLNHQGFTLPSGEVIRFENMVKTLGVMVDNTLSWKPQVD